MYRGLYSRRRSDPLKTLVRTLGTPVFLGLLLAGRGALALQEGDSPEARFIRSARAAIESGREAAAARLREAKEAVAAQARDEAERDQRLARALQESTSRVPLRVSLDRNAVLDGVRVSGYAAGAVTLAWPQGEVQVPLAGPSDDARSAVVSIALSRGNARDCYKLGKLLLPGRDFEGAARASAASVRLDPALASHPTKPAADRPPTGTLRPAVRPV